MEDGEKRNNAYENKAECVSSLVRVVVDTLNLCNCSEGFAGGCLTNYMGRRQGQGGGVGAKGREALRGWGIKQ